MLSEKPWTFERLIRVIMAMLFFIGITMLVFSGLLNYLNKEKFEGSVAYLVLGAMGIHWAILLGTAVTLALDRVTWRDAFGFSKSSVGHAVLFGLSTALVILPVAYMLQGFSGWLLNFLHVPTPAEPAVEQFTKATSPAAQASLVLFSIVLAPFVEEVLFRGILYGSLKQIGFPRLALWGSALCFGAAHMLAWPPPVSYFIPLTLLGLIFVWLYERTDNLLTPIAAHATFNGIGVLLMHYGDSLTQSFQRLFPHLR